ncbi:MAG: hypothetical protein HY263_01095 [Chloroflexi bacterium]|nr:hypothetical protein [Chloroflexota bacterium]
MGFTRLERLAFPEPLPHVYGGSDVRGAVQFGDGYVAVGEVNGGCCDGSFSTDTHGVVWRSADGLAWTLEPRAAVFDLARPMGLASDGHRLVAIGVTITDADGQTVDHGAVWVSDDGQAWQRGPAVPFFTAVVAATDGFVAAADGSDGPEMWASPDGLHWSIAATSSTLGQGSIRAMSMTPAGIVAVGSGSPGSQSTNVAVAWRSTDGVHWTRATPGPWSSNATMSMIAVSGSSIVAVGTDLAAAAALWRSVDGLTWTREPSAPIGDTGASIWGIIAGSRGFLVVGSIEGNLPRRIVWQSADGVAWTELETPDDFRADMARGIQAGDDLVLFTMGFDAAAGRAIPQAWSVR